MVGIQSRMLGLEGYMDFLIKPCSFLFIIFLTYMLKRAGMFKKELSMIVMKIILNVTLPAVVISAFADLERDISLLLLVILGFGSALGSYFLMYALTKNTRKEKRVYDLIGVSGYNVGCYGMPVISAFFGSIGTITSIMFDIGNSAMMIGGNYAFTSILLHTDGKDTSIRLSDLLKRFFSSAAMITYMAVLVLCIMGISIPQRVADFVNPLSSANAFLSMFMLGLLFTLPGKKEDWKSTFVILAFRFAVGAALAAVMFHILPFSLEIRRIVVLLLLCPMGSVAPAFIERCGGDGELASFTNSMSTLSSLIVMTALAGYFN